MESQISPCTWPSHGSWGTLAHEVAKTLGWNPELVRNPFRNYGVRDDMFLDETTAEVSNCSQRCLPSDVTTAAPRGGRAVFLYLIHLVFCKISQVWVSELRELSVSRSSYCAEAHEIIIKIKHSLLGWLLNVLSAYNTWDSSGTSRLHHHPSWFLRIKGRVVGTSNLFTALQAVGADLSLKIKLSS